MTTAAEVARAFGVPYDGIKCRIPGPNRDRNDRAVVVWNAPGSPYGIRVHSHRDEPFGEILEYISTRVPLAKSKPDTELARQHERKSRQQQAVKEKKNSQLCRFYWHDSWSIGETPADIYLQSRGLHQPYPLDLRYHPDPLGQGADVCGAMVAKVINMTARQATGIHLTYLYTSGRKARRVAVQKRMYGTIRGSGVWPLERGAVIGMAEGIETALSFQLQTGIPTVAALSAGNLCSIQIPDDIARIVFAIDNDESGVGLKKAEQAARMHWRRGRTIEGVMPEARGDFNDIWRLA